MRVEDVDAILRNVQASVDQQKAIADSSSLPADVVGEVQRLASQFHASLFTIGLRAALNGKEGDCVSVAKLARDLLMTELDALLVSMEIASPEVKQ